MAGGGVLYSGAEQTLLDFARTHNIPLIETQSGKGAVDWDILRSWAPYIVGGAILGVLLVYAGIMGSPLLGGLGVGHM